MIWSKVGKGLRNLGLMKEPPVPSDVAALVAALTPEERPVSYVGMNDHDEYFETLRRKWGEVPGGSDQGSRRMSSSVVSFSDNDLLAFWEAEFSAGSHIELRGWYQLLYRDLFRGKRVLEIGSGLGFDGVYFLGHGAEWTFCDIVASNLEAVRRIVELKRFVGGASYLLIENMSSFERLAKDYDVIWCNGSLINAPFAHAREESLRVLEHLRPGGRWIELGYPPERWLREGSPPLSEWGKMTDGEGTPWCEWYDLEKLRQRLYPAKMKPILNMHFSSSSFVWFDLLFDEEEPFRLSSARLAKPHQIMLPLRCITISSGAIKYGARCTVTTPEALWHYAASVEVAEHISALRAASRDGSAIVADIVCTVETGAIGIAFADPVGGFTSREVIISANRHPQRVTVRLEAQAPAARIILRNCSGKGQSVVSIATLMLRQVA